MADALTKACRREVEHYVRDLLATAPLVADAIGRLPIDAADFIELDRETLQHRLTNALCAFVWFDQQKPEWAPPLPLTKAKCEALQYYPDVRQKFLGCFGDSLRFVRWNYRQHVDFRSYCRGLMATPYLPNGWREDPALRREFPPQGLAIADGLAIVPMNGVPEDLRIPFLGERPARPPV